MLDAFVPLETYLIAPPREDAVAVTPVADEEVPPRDDTFDEMLARVRRFRAALADALDASLDDLLREIAAGVLARELTVAPADLAAIVRDAIERHPQVAFVRAHPTECEALAACGVDVVADARLRRGDVSLGVRDGTIDESFGARLQRALDACRR